MRDLFSDRLLWRELGPGSKRSTIKGIYGDKRWVKDLDIVNELDGHTGCVNALSWSTSGKLLASGSDDKHLNLHRYQPEDSSMPFLLDTTIETGHRANIFSVKFMPHSGDRTLVTAAGDAEVRVFDIETHSSGSRTGSEATTARGMGLQNLYKGVRYLYEGDTKARVYRSHADRVKRIVTESSPHLFLTCSEDGEVRQFDLRLPSSAYPAPRGRRGFLPFRDGVDSANVPPPLISYKRFNLDLNTISCSASQPHYIALAGAHLHCFLHDRRMIGRNIDEERGTPDRTTPASSMTSIEDEAMSQATRCVRRFAPNGTSQAKRHDSRHITACKISDANPNELIASWSGDHIYSFDIIRSQRESADERLSIKHTKSRESRDRKRKRHKNDSSLSCEGERKSSKPRAAYDNSQIEDLPTSASGSSTPRISESAMEQMREAVLTDSQRRSLQIAKCSVKIRKVLFSLEGSPHNAKVSMEPIAHRMSFTAALGYAATCYAEMRQISNSWRYPVDPSEFDVSLQQTLRANRNSSQHFVQAAGSLARSLGGRLQTGGSSSGLTEAEFESLLPVQSDKHLTSQREFFLYTFLRAILLWLGGGRPGLLQGFKQSADHRKDPRSFPLPDRASEEAIEKVLIPHLFNLAGDGPLINVDASRFELENSRILFKSEEAAVIAFSHAIKMPLEDAPVHSDSRDANLSGSPHSLGHSRDIASKFWGFKVGRSILLKAGEGVNFQFVDIAFGGLGNTTIEDDRARDSIETDEENPTAQSASLISFAADSEEGEEGGLMSGLLDAEALSRDPEDDSEEEEDNDERYDDEYFDDDDDDDDDEDQDVDDSEHPFIFRSALERRRDRDKVETQVPCYSHTRTYRGHCNVKTVKDANFFGLQDEYVVSGSDGGHLFIWDKRTSELVNILQGDDQVVNVIQGHPYEPILAVSGIDNTIKIFSPDARAREDAKNGINVGSLPSSKRPHHQNNNNNPTLSSSSYRHHRRRDSDSSRSRERPTQGLTSKKCMHDSYSIMSQNDVQRQGGMRDAYVTVGPFPTLETMPIMFSDWLAWVVAGDS